MQLVQPRPALPPEADIPNATAHVSLGHQPRGDGSDLRLTKMLEQAELVRVESVARPDHTNDPTADHVGIETAYLDASFSFSITSSMLKVAAF